MRLFVEFDSNDLTGNFNHKCRDRHPDNHSNQPEEITEYENGDKHPDRGNSDFIAKDFWRNNVCINLLNDENKNGEYQGFGWTNEENHNR